MVVPADRHAQTHFEKAIALNPSDATSRHLLGLWCFTFADMAWCAALPASHFQLSGACRYKASVAAALFATPPTSTYAEALAHFEAAEKCLT